MLFTGYEFDYETGYNYANFREQSPATSRFFSPDPLAGDISNPQSLNRYSYVLNNPTNGTDPLGLSTIGRGGCGGDRGTPCGSPALLGVCPTGYGCAMGSTCMMDGVPFPCNSGLLGSAETTAVCPNSDCSLVHVDAETGEWVNRNFNACYLSMVGQSWAWSLTKAFFSWQPQRDAWNKGYYKCLGKKTAGGATAPVVTHAVGAAATNAAKSGASTIAGAYYHFTDGRFTAWGKYSKVLVPNLAPKVAAVAETLDVAGWAYFNFELAKAIGECSEVLK